MRIGIDFGGTKIEGLAMDSAGVELARLRVPTPRDYYAETVSVIAGVVAALERRTQQVGTVGVCIPGTVVASTGLVKNANSTWLNGRPLCDDLSAAMGREVRCANDANCFAVSEAVDGAAKGYGVVFGVIVGTGCGGGVALHGKVHNGPNGLAGEWGHTPLPWMRADEFPGSACYCGRHGCVETWISGTGFARDFAQVAQRSLRAEQIVAAAAEGDLEALAAFDRLEDRMARSLSLIVDVLDPEAIVLGGGLSRIDRIYEGISQRLGEYCFGGDVQVKLLRALHGDSSGVRGAAWLWDGSSASTLLTSSPGKMLSLQTPQ
jgi:fructokinase